MKNIFAMLSSVLFFLPVTAEAYDFEVGGIYYDVTSSSDQTVRVTYKEQLEQSYSGDIIIPDSVTYENKTYAVKSIGNYAFFFCKTLTSVAVPSSVTMIEDHGAFGNCENMEKVVFSEGLKVISNQTFSDCISLKEIVIPNSVTKIDYYAFHHCERLEKVTLGKNVDMLGTVSNSQGVFASCGRINEVKVLMQKPFPINFNTFDYDVYRQATLRVPVGAKSLYATCAGWKQFVNIVEDPECGTVGQESTASLNVNDFFNIGDKLGDGVVTVVNKDRLCFVVSYKGKTYTVNKQLIVDLASYMKEHAGADNRKAIKDLSKTWGIDNLEGDYASTLLIMANKMLATV